MSSIIENTSTAFSSGKFVDTYEHMSEMIVWNLVGADLIQGKTEVIEACEKMLLNMVGSELQNTHQITEGNQVAVQGYRRFMKEGRPAQLFYCDVYQFEQDQIISITSYAIESSNAD